MSQGRLSIILEAFSPTADRKTIFLQLLWKAETPKNTQAKNAFIQTRKYLFREVSSHNHNGP